jgi:ribosome-binding ATPase
VKVGIVGLPQVGKTTIFNLLTRGNVDTSSWGGRTEAHIGVADVPDPRLDRLDELFTPKKKVCATIEYVDLPGLARGEGKAALEGNARDLSTYLNSLKNADALLHVVRAFEDDRIPHPEGSVDPARDIALFDLEMIFSDLAIVEKRLERLGKGLKKARTPDLETEYSVLLRYKEALESEAPLRAVEVSAEELRLVKGFTFLSAKPLLQALNLGDRDVPLIAGAAGHFGLQAVAALPRVHLTAVCGKIESEIASLSPEDACLFMQDLGLAEGGLDRIIHESYSLLGLISFYTASETEVRAWTIPCNSRALQASGVIHSDF